MKKLLLTLLFAGLGLAQNITTYYATPQSPVPTVITQTGATGTTTYCYWVVAIYTGGKSAPGGPACTSTANSTLSSTNYDVVAFLAPTSPLSAVTGYDILRTTSQTPPTISGCSTACSVATNQAASPVNDQSNTTSSYTLATVTGAITQYADNTSLTATTLVTTGPAKFTGVITPAGGQGQVTTTVSYTQFMSPLAPLVALMASSTDPGSSLEGETELFIPTNATLTGVCMLMGSGASTDKWVGILRNSSGVALANSATTGQTLGTASTLNCQAFTATVPVVGPQTYYIGIQTNGTTANEINLYQAGALPTSYGCGQVSATFGTIAAQTMPTTFTAAKCGLVAVY